MARIYGEDYAHYHYDQPTNAPAILPILAARNGTYRPDPYTQARMDAANAQLRGIEAPKDFVDPIVPEKYATPVPYYFRKDMSGNQLFATISRGIVSPQKANLTESEACNEEILDSIDDEDFQGPV